MITLKTNILPKGVTALFLSVLILTSCQESSEVVAPASNTLDEVTTLLNDGDFSDDNARAGIRFKNLFTALNITGLRNVVRQNQLTVFAPTDAAFEDLFAVLGVSSVNEIPKDLLTTVLLYHVVSGNVFAADLVDDVDVPTVQGQTIGIELTGGPQIEDATDVNANIIKVDITGARVVLHVIDKVLLPAL